MPMQRDQREILLIPTMRTLLLGMLVLTLSACSSLFGGNSDKAAPPPTATAGAGVGVGVNNYLWRASLDTISFMPLASADPFGGVIITDWYAPSSTPAERFKVTVYILDRQLRADALKVSVFRQQRGTDGEWSDAALDPETPSKLENAILTRARQLRIASIGE